MERLTMRYDTHVAVVCENCDKHLECNGGVICGEVLRNRLAAYEDAIPLERAQELVQAEKDGRLVVLPCKAGDTVYIIRDKKMFIATVEAIHQWISGMWKLSVHTDKRYTHWVGYEVSFEDFGKTVFLTREEAEVALKKREVDNAKD